MNQSLYPERIINLNIFMMRFRKKQDQQTENGKNRSHFIYNIGLNKRKVAPLTVKACNGKYPGYQPGRLMTCKIGIEQKQAQYT